MIAYVHQFVVPAAYALLPAAMESTPATALLLAIALQESRCVRRRQLRGGPARGFWQFERDGGIAGVISHHATRSVISDVLTALRYPVTAEASYAAVEHNDTLAACFARCLLWTVAEPLPARQDTELAWRQYLEAWRPGRPHRSTWHDHYAQAWRLVEGRA